MNVTIIGTGYVGLTTGLDERIGTRFLHAGIGWGGSCFGEDTRTIIATANRYNHPMPIVRSSCAAALASGANVEPIDATLAATPRPTAADGTYVTRNAGVGA